MLLLRSQVIKIGIFVILICSQIVLKELLA